MSQTLGAVRRPEQFNLVLVLLRPGEIVVERVEVAMPCPSDLPDETEVDRVDEFLE